jgi:Asp/Glu/hydantoin racemase
VTAGGTTVAEWPAQGTMVLTSLVPTGCASRMGWLLMTPNAATGVPVTDGVTTASVWGISAARRRA